MSTAIGTYVSLETRTGANTNNNYQNFHAGETRTYESVDYMYGAFGFSGASVDINAASISAQLQFSVNPIILNIAETAAINYWIARVKTVWLNPDDFSETSQRMEEVYAITGLSMTIGTRSLEQPLDAVQQDATAHA